MEVAGGYGGHWAGGAAGQPQLGQRSRLARCPLSLLCRPHLAANPQGSEDTKGQARPLPPGPGISRCLLSAGPQPHRRLVGGEGRAGTPLGPTEPQAPRAQLSWSSWGGREGPASPIAPLRAPLHGLRAGPLNLLTAQ